MAKVPLGLALHREPRGAYFNRMLKLIFYAYLSLGFDAKIL